MRLPIPVKQKGDYMSNQSDSLLQRFAEPRLLVGRYGAQFSVGETDSLPVDSCVD